MSTGRVKWSNADRGYRFITTDARQGLFIHYSETQTSRFRTLEERAKVNFKISTNDRGDHAANVAVI